MPVVGTRTNASARAYGWSATIPESLDGMVLVMPTSVAKTGTGSTATIGTNGSVTFSSCETLSLNGVFTSDYENYLMVTTFTSGQITQVGVHCRFRASGTDNTTNSSYYYQNIRISGVSENATRGSGTFGLITQSATTGPVAMTAYIFAPYIAEETVIRANSRGLTSMYYGAMSHNSTTSFDGITIYPQQTSITGSLSIYGLEN